MMMCGLCFIKIIHVLFARRTTMVLCGRLTARTSVTNACARWGWTLAHRIPVLLPMLQYILHPSSLSWLLCLASSLPAWPLVICKKSLENPYFVLGRSNGNGQTLSRTIDIHISHVFSVPLRVTVVKCSRM